MTIVPIIGLLVSHTLFESWKRHPLEGHLDGMVFGALAVLRVCALLYLVWHCWRVARWFLACWRESRKHGREK